MNKLKLVGLVLMLLSAIAVLTVMVALRNAYGAQVCNTHCYWVGGQQYCTTTCYDQ